MRFRKYFPVVLTILFVNCQAQSLNVSPKNSVKASVITGAEQTALYLPLIKGKRVGVLVNPTSIIRNKALVDSLLKLEVNIVGIFGPEHGFRGNASAGAVVNDTIDATTGIPVVSLYGKKSKPSKADLHDVDIMIFDIQDVGARFYTYINVLKSVMEACAENGKELIVLDRPNPNGFYVDGPVLDMKLKSGIGMFSIPIVHGMTMGEFAQMINGEGWLANGLKCNLHIIKLKHYTHDTPYVLPVPPSPNLNTWQAILLYPSVCLFEGTVISLGRGTYFPFTVLGNPKLKDKYPFSFRPQSIKGMSESPLFMDQECFGEDLRKYDTNSFRSTRRLNLKWLMEMYQAYPEKEKFFDSKQSPQMGDFDKLAGNTLLRQQIINGVSEEEIRKSWEPALSQYKEMRKKYLLYP
jgi:uncharacterized protein YbbC (DUF1343 family)